jgi:hypothetical protein
VLIGIGEIDQLVRELHDALRRPLTKIAKSGILILLHVLRSPAPTGSEFRRTTLAESQNALSGLAQSLCAPRGGPFLSCKAANHSHSLIEGVDLS